MRGIRTEVALGVENGLRTESAATFDNLQMTRRSWLTDRIGALRPDQGNEICTALGALADC